MITHHTKRFLGPIDDCLVGRLVDFHVTTKKKKTKKASLLYQTIYDYRDIETDTSIFIEIQIRWNSVYSTVEWLIIINYYLLSMCVDFFFTQTFLRSMN